MTEMESTVHDTTDQSVESSGSDTKPIVVEELSKEVNTFDAQIGGLENVGCTSAARSNVGDILTIVPNADTKDEAKQPSKHTYDEAKQPSKNTKDDANRPLSGILDKSDAQNGSTSETVLRIDGGSSNGERLQLGKAPELDSASLMFDFHASRNSTVSRSLGYGFEMGDMVWGRVKSHPWWPGQIFNGAFASPSVWRAKKDGQVLVAFFGDSSYGWFDPAELIPYELHFVEKSQQSTSRNFMKAVEESVDEGCRRSALGLTCFCRNPYNFRPTNVPGHMAVDVFDYEPGGIYSHDQIQKARDNFQPQQTLSFIEQLAANPQRATMSLDFVREKAVAFTYRRAVFEEFDETYAQAFGQEPVRPAVAPPPSIDQSIRAHLSGRLVIAESLSGRRSSTKAVKSKEQSKRDGYLFKRRDESVDLGTSQMRSSTSFSSSAGEDRLSNSAAGDYVLQRGDQAVFHGDQQEGAWPASSRSVNKAVAGAGKEVGNARLSTDQDRPVGEDTGVAKESDPSTGKKSKKVGVLKGASKQSNAEKSELGEKKKRRKTDPLGSSDHLQKHSSAGNVGGASGKGEIPGRPIQNGAPSRAESQPKGISTSSTSEQVPVMPSGAGDVVLPQNKGALQQVLVDLKVLAWDPSHGSERNRPAIARQIFLRFRSLVFQKSLPASSDTEASEVRSARTSSGGAGISPSYPSGENTRNAHPSKPPKPLGRPDDPTKVGRKRVPSEHQEDVAAKRAKKASAMKSTPMSTEKRKAPEVQHPDAKGKGIVIGPPRTGGKVEASVKMQPPKMRVEEPTFLVMKYSPGTSIPSGAELKARFARFGLMDTSQNRVFYTTNMCRILFLYKEDAERAYRYALGNKSDFANARFMLKPHSVAPDPQAADKLSRDSNRAGEDPAIDHLQPTPPLMQPSSAVRLKSCLKKPAGDEGGIQNSSGLRGARVRFNMDPRTSNGFTSLSETGPRSSSSLSSALDVRDNQQKALSRQHNHPPQVEVALRSHTQHHAYTTRLPLGPTQAPQLPPPVDLTQQMLSLLTRCNEVVTNMKAVLGYIPYHPL